MRVLGPALLVFAVQLVFLWIPPLSSPQVYVLGFTRGLLVALMATGLWLVHRANRVVNFAQADLGLLPASLSVNLVVLSGISYLVALLAGLAAALVVGAVAELAVFRRFFGSARLVATVATIGLAQLLAAAALWLPIELWDREPVLAPFAAEVFPLHWTLTIRGPPFGSAHMATWLLAPLALLAVGAMLRGSDLGTAVRASAESAERAQMLGIPVRRLHTLIWAVAGALSFLSLFLSAGLFGLPVGGALGLTALLGGLTALVLGRDGGLAGVVVASVAVGMLAQAVTWKSSMDLLGLFEIPLSDQAVPAVLGAVIVAALVFQHRGGTRAEMDRTSTWSDSEAVRPIPRSLARLPVVRNTRALPFVAVPVGLLCLPLLLGSAANTSRAAALVGFALIGVSLVVLVGWAGQVSLGQLAFAAVGGVAGAKAILDWGFDPVLALLFAAMAGAAVAVLVGLPALRVRGLYLAVVTLAFALAAVGYFLNPTYFSWVPTGRMAERPEVLGTFGIDEPRSFYYFCVVVGLAGVAFLAKVGTSRTGRVLMAVRDNENAAAAYGVPVVRAKLLGFALSGATAAVGGCLLVLLQRGYTANLFGAFDNLVVFSAVVVGGAGSLLGGIIGAVLVQAGDWWLPGNWRLLASGAGVLAVLLVLPGGLGGALFSLRDSLLRAVAARRGVDAPGIVPERPGEDESPGMGIGIGQAPGGSDDDSHERTGSR